MEPSVEALKGNYHTNPIFEFFNQEEFDYLLKIVDQVVYEPKEIIFETGQEPRGLYIITEGQVAISQRREGRPEKVLATIEPPTVLGEMALLKKRQRTSTARAVERTTVLFLDKEKFTQALANNEIFAFKLSHNLGTILAQKIETMNEAMMSMKQQFKEFNNFKNTLFSDWNF